MNFLRKAVLLSLIAATPSAVIAQQAGTIELGGYLHATKLDKDIQIGSTSIGAGARAGFFVHRLFSIEGSADIGTASSTDRGVNAWGPARAMVVGNFPITNNVKFLLGAGVKGDHYFGDTTGNKADAGTTYLAGLRICLRDAWTLRPEFAFDYVPSVQGKFHNPSAAHLYGFRIGISKFFRRGTDACGAPAPKAPPPPPPAPVRPPAPPPPPAPTASLTASPSSVTAGQNSRLTWSSSNATQCNAPWMSGSSANGSQSVSPTSTTTYSITCSGAGGSANASATVNVTQPPPPPVRAPAPPPREIFRLEGVYFDFDKSTLKPEGKAKLDDAVAILNRYSDVRVEIQGHADSIGTNVYNQGLSERRSKAVYDYLVSKGITASRMTTRGFGEERPVADNGTRSGRALNRRVVIIEIRQ